MEKSIQKIESVVGNYLEKISCRDISKIVSNAKLISDKFTLERATLSKNYLDAPEMRAAYISHFLITNVAKVLFCLDKIISNWIPDKLSILDLGMGPGTAILAASSFLADHYPHTHIEFTGLEQCRPVIHDAIALFEMLGNKNHHLNTIAGSLNDKNAQAQLSGKKFDIIIAANFFNEFYDDKSIIKAIKHITEWHLKDNGYFIIIDPALQKTTRQLMAVRDPIVGTDTMKILAPCLHQKNCPMLAENERDWCHFYIEWKRPALIEKMDALVGTDHTYLKLAYFIFTKGEKDCFVANAPRNDNLFAPVIASEAKQSPSLISRNDKI